MKIWAKPKCSVFSLLKNISVYFLTLSWVGQVFLKLISWVIMVFYLSNPPYQMMHPFKGTNPNSTNVHSSYIQQLKYIRISRARFKAGNTFN